MESKASLLHAENVKKNPLKRSTEVKQGCPLIRVQRVVAGWRIATVPGGGELRYRVGKQEERRRKGRGESVVGEYGKV